MAHLAECPQSGGEALGAELRQQHLHLPGHSCRQTPGVVMPLGGYGPAPVTQRLSPKEVQRVEPGLHQVLLLRPPPVPPAPPGPTGSEPGPRRTGRKRCWPGAGQQHAGRPGGRSLAVADAHSRLQASWGWAEGSRGTAASQQHCRSSTSN